MVLIVALIIIPRRTHRQCRFGAPTQSVRFNHSENYGKLIEACCFEGIDLYVNTAVWCLGLFSPEKATLLATFQLHWVRDVAIGLRRSQVLGLTTPPFGETIRDERLAELAAMLDAFSEGGRFSVADNPRRKPRDAMLARVLPVDAGFWSLRVSAPGTPGIRALGAFVEKDAFAVLAWHMREDMVSYDDRVTDVRLIWSDLFGDAVPHSGHSLDAYLSNYWRV